MGHLLTRQDCLESVGKVGGHCLESVGKVGGHCLESVGEGSMCPNGSFTHKARLSGERGKGWWSLSGERGKGWWSLSGERGRRVDVSKWVIYSQGMLSNSRVSP